MSAAVPECEVCFTDNGCMSFERVPEREAGRRGLRVVETEARSDRGC